MNASRPLHAGSPSDWGDRALIGGLLLSILMVIAPHTTHLPLWVSALCISLLIWRGYLAWHAHPLPKRWLLATITIAAIGAILIDYHTLFGREVGVTMLMLLATLKLMELKSTRDAMALIYLSCFIMITHFLYSQTLTTFLYLLITLLVITVTWVHLHAPHSAFKARLKIASILVLQAIPLTIILFVLFPRIQGPLWGLPQDAFASSGLDDSMSPGSMGKLVLSEAVAFRASFQGPPPRRDQMYWRGPVLWNFDGRTWTPGKRIRSAAPQFSDTSQPITYSVTLEPHNKRWLFALDVPEKISIPARLTDDFQILSPNPVNARLRYEAKSNLIYLANVEESAWQLQRALQLPPALNPRAQQLATDWRAASATNEEIVSRTLSLFNQQNFSYTLEPPPLSEHAIDDFLFTTRQGFCEHYASAFVYLMRAAGIPARVVTGYQGGEYNAFGKYYIVRQSDAHAWAEVWLTHRGWVRIDPTASIAPERVAHGLSAALPDNAALSYMARNPFLRELRLNLDALSYQWNSAIIGYDHERQFALMSRLGLESWSWQQLAVNMVAGLGAVIALFALYMLRHLFKREPDKTQAAWLKICRKLAKSGFTRQPYEGPWDFAMRVARARADLSDSIQDLAARYITLRYGQPENMNAQREFISLANKFRSFQPTGNHTGDKSRSML